MSFRISKASKILLLTLLSIGLAIAALPSKSHAGGGKVLMQPGFSPWDFTEDLSFRHEVQVGIARQAENKIDRSSIRQTALDRRDLTYQSVAVGSSQVKFSVEPSRLEAVAAGTNIGAAGKTVLPHKQTQYKIHKELDKARNLLSFKSRFGTMGGSPRGYYILGRIFADFNENGLFDPGEPGIPDVLVEIRNDKRGKLGQVTTDGNGLFDTRALSTSAFDTHSFVVPESTEEMSKPYSNEMLAAYFNFVPAPKGDDRAEVVLGFAVDVEALLSDLAGNAVTTNGLTPEQWAARLASWSTPYRWSAGGRESSGLDVLTDDDPSPGARFRRELLTLELNHRSRLGLAGADVAWIDLQEILVDYGYYLISNTDPALDARRAALLEIFKAVNSGQ